MTRRIVAAMGACVLLTVAGGLGQPAAAQGRAASTADDTAALEALNLKYLAGASFNEILAPDFRVTQADGSILGREAFIASRTPAPPAAATRRSLDLEIRVFGDTGLVHARVEGFRYTDVYHKGPDGRWLAAAAQITRIAEPPH